MIADDSDPSYSCLMSVISDDSYLNDVDVTVESRILKYLAENDVFDSNSMLMS